MPTKFYLAGPFPHMAKIRDVADKLVELGYEVPAGWLYGREYLPKSLRDDAAAYVREEKTDAQAWHTFSLIASNDLHDIDECDVLVKFPTFPGYTSGGRLVEMGYAIGQGLDIIVVGKREQVFDWLPEVVQVQDVEELLTYIGDRYALYRTV